MQCPECKSNHIHKNGKKKGKQNYICVDCQRQFLDCYQIQRGYSNELKRVQPGILGWAVGDRSAKTFKTLWEIVRTWKCYFYVTDGWNVYPMFIPDGDQIVSKTYMTRVEGENTRLRHYLARLHRKTLCYSKSEIMLKHSVKLLIHYLRFKDVPVPYVQKCDLI